MSALAKGFSTAWKDLKKVTLAAANFIVKNESKIQDDVKIASVDLAAVAPSLSPAITIFDDVEEEIAGAVFAVASDVTKAATLQGLFGEAWPTIQALVGQLKSHPAVVAATVPAVPAK